VEERWDGMNAGCAGRKGDWGWCMDKEGKECDGGRWSRTLKFVWLRLGNVLLVLPAEVDEGNARISLKNWARSSYWTTRGILDFCGEHRERENKVSVYDLTVRHARGRDDTYCMYEKDWGHTASALIKVKNVSDGEYW